MKKLKRYAGIFKNVRIPWLLLVIVLVIAVCNTYLELGYSTMTADIIDSTQNAIRGDLLIEFIVTLAVYSLCLIAETYTSNLAFEKINRGVRVKLWNKIMRLPTRYYDGENGDELVGRVTTDASESYVYFNLVISFVAIANAVVASVRQMYKYSPQLTMYMLLILPVCAAVAAILGRLNFVANKKAQVAFAETLAYLVERTRSLRLIKAARTEYTEQEIGKKKFHRQFRVSLLASIASSSNVLVMEIIACVSMIISFAFGGRLVSRGEITIGRLVGFYSITNMFSIRIMQLIMFYGELRAADGRLEKIARVLETPDETDDGIELDVPDADLIAKDVTFSYGDRSTLRNVNFHIPKGEVTAIIGANGAGKSTMFKLLERMYDPDSGAILFGDEDARTFSLRSWRESFAIVSQDKPLLSGTVRENILYGVRRKVTEDELIYVAKQANVYDFVMATPGGFDAQVGPNGSNFSGGQRQCIAIARAGSYP